MAALGMGYVGMTTEYPGRGNPQRSLELLWGEPKVPSRGPKPGLDLARIVRTAIELADAEGLAALSMRRVAERLGVGAMSLYTYIPGKAELLDLMLDQVQGELLMEELPGGDWRARLEARARQDWALYERHPWLLQICPCHFPPLRSHCAIGDEEISTMY